VVRNLLKARCAFLAFSDGIFLLTVLIAGTFAERTVRYQ
jgi:hypothetical protein